MKIEILFFAECPSWQQAVENMRTALAAEKVYETIHLIEIQTNEEAAQEKFLGSPSFRINGQELWPEDREDYFLGCRIYHTKDGLIGVPTVEMLREKIHQYSSIARPPKPDSPRQSPEKRSIPRC